MKFKLLLCGATLLVGGCASQQSPFDASGEFSYSYDLVPSPAPDVAPSDLDKILKAPSLGAANPSIGALGQTSAGVQGGGSN
jgi:hypothetical protein